jgi:hypothetical protein
MDLFDLSKIGYSYSKLQRNHQTAKKPQKDWMAYRSPIAVTLRTLDDE